MIKVISNIIGMILLKILKIILIIMIKATIFFFLKTWLSNFLQIVFFAVMFECVTDSCSFNFGNFIPQSRTNDR